MGVSFRVRPLAASYHGRCSVEGRENKQRGKWFRRTEERKHICEQIGSELDCTGDVVDRLVRVIAQDERVRGQWLGTVRTALLQARHACQSEMGAIHNEHWVSSYTCNV